MAKTKKDAKGGGDAPAKGKKDQGAPAGGIRLSGHPRAQRDIAMAKSWGGLAAFVLVLVLSLRAGLTTSDALLRAIAGGFAGYVLAWAVAVTVWRHLAIAELEQARRRLMAPSADDDPDVRPTA